MAINLIGGHVVGLFKETNPHCGDADFSVSRYFFPTKIISMGPTP